MSFAKKLGELLMPFSKGVDLRNPEVNLQVEIRRDVAYFFTDSITGLDGMPPASSGKVLCLFSGGIDSPVAAFQMLKRGVAVDYLFVDLSGNKTSLVNIAKLFNHLSTQFSFNYKPVFYFVDGRSIVEHITKSTPSSFRQLALKIAFYKLGELFISHKKYNALVTGESIAQKSSQTIPSLSFIQSQSSALVLRPLISMDKLEITRIAESIGTIGASQYLKKYCDL
jgi:thiamine biosynthesis protein ThiI